jgi:DNA topoisomerase-1
MSVLLRDGLATLRREHVTIGDRSVVFDYPAKGAVRRVHEVADQQAVDGLRSDEINDYIKAGIGEDFTAKDFRTWNATVLAAALLAADRDVARSKTGRKRVINACVRDVAEQLGNTPAVARRAYIDPRVFDRYQSGWTIGLSPPADVTLDRMVRHRRRLELAVLELLDGET